MQILLSEILQLSAAPVWEGSWCLTPTCPVNCSLVEVVRIYRQSFFLLLGSFLLVQISCFIPMQIIPNLESLYNITEIPQCHFIFLNKMVLFIYGSLFDLLCNTCYWFIYRITGLGKNGLLPLWLFLWNIMKQLPLLQCLCFLNSPPYLSCILLFGSCFLFCQPWPCTSPACQKDGWITHLWGSSSSAS